MRPPHRGHAKTSATKLQQGYEKSEKKSIRLKESWTNKRKLATNGERKLTGRCPAWLKLSKDGKRFEVLRERTQVVSQIFEMKLAGKGSERIASELNKLNVWAPKNGWRKSYINKLLHHNRALIGEYQPCKMLDGKRTPDGNPIPNYFPAIVDKIFYRVQPVIKRNREKLCGWNHRAYRAQPH